MKFFKGLCFCCSFVVVMLFGYSQDQSITAMVVSESGMVVTNYHLVAEAKSIRSRINEKEIKYEVIKKDAINDLALLKPDQKVSVRPLRLFLGEIDGKKPLKNIHFVKQEKGKLTQLSSKVQIKKTANNYDIRYMELELASEGPVPDGGPVFNEKGLCIGLVCNRVTDIYSLIHGKNEGLDRSFAIKVEYLFPLLKDVEGVIWAKNDESHEKDDWQTLNESILYLDVAKGESFQGKAFYFDDIRKRIPENVLFISIALSSGIHQNNFAELLVGALKKHKIGNEVDPNLKQQFYQAVHETYGGVGPLTARDLVKMSADLAKGYYLEASCNIAFGEVEDSVYLRLYNRETPEVVAEVRVSEVMPDGVDTAIGGLIEKAVLELIAKLKAAKSDLVA